MSAPHEQFGAEEVSTLLQEAAAFGETELSEFVSGEVRCFAADGVLTNNAGFTVRLQDGSEFQVTVVKSRGCHRDYLPEDGSLDSE
jgi:hypothetical protein